MKTATPNRRPAGRTRGKGLIAVLAGASLVLLPALAIGSPASANETVSPVLSANQVDDLQPADEVITVSGVGFAAETTFILANSATAESGTVLDQKNAQDVTTDAEGSFEQDLNIPAAFGETDCQEAQCDVVVATIDDNGDVVAAATLPIAYQVKSPEPVEEIKAPAEEAEAVEASEEKEVESSGSVEVAAPAKAGIAAAPVRALTKASVKAAAQAGMTVSKTSGVASGEKVSVNGSGFKDGGLFLALCNTNAAPGGACDMANFAQVQAKGGKFSGSITLQAKYTAGDGSSVDCMKDPCALQTSKVGNGADTSQTVTIPISFSDSAGGGDAAGDGAGDAAGDGAGAKSGGAAGGPAGGAGAAGGLPTTGVESMTMPIVGGLVFLFGGLALMLTSRRRSTLSE